MLRSLCLAAALSFSATDALAQTAPTRKAPAKPKRPRPAPSTGDSQAPSTSTKTGEQGTAAAPSKADSAAAGAGTTSAPAAATAGASTAQAPRGFDQEEFRRQVMEEVRRELQKTKDEVKQETAWVEQDSQARVQDSEAVESLKQSGDGRLPRPVHAALRLGGAARFRHRQREARLGQGEHPARRVALRPHGLSLGPRDPAQRRQLPRLRLRRHLRPDRVCAA